jgi:protein-disulfide isomerase
MPNADESGSEQTPIRYLVGAFRLRNGGLGARGEEKSMIQIKRPVPGARLFLPLLALVFASGPSCKRPEKEPDAVAASSEASSTACTQFVSQLCGRAGEKSQICTSGKTIGKVLPERACQEAVNDFARVEKQIDSDRKVCTDLTERLCKDIGADTDSCRMVREQTPQFPPEQCQDISSNYQQVLDELKQAEAKNKPLSPETQAKIAGGGAPSFGPENAKVTIVEFSDFQCPFCTRAAGVVHQIREKYGDRVRFVFRQYPLPMHGDAHLAAQAALAAHEQGKFWEYHDLLFANQRALTRPSLEEYAKQVNLDIPRLKRALDDHSLKAAVDADVKLGEEVNVSGTPTVFINGKRVPNPTEFAPVAQLIDAALGA